MSRAIATPTTSDRSRPLRGVAGTPGVMRLVSRAGFGLAAAMMAGCAGTPQAPPTDRWEADIQAFEQADRERPPPEGAVLFVGSSSIRLWDTLGEDLEGVQVINRGFGGSEMDDALRFTDRIILPYRPRQVVVYAGDNDLWSGKSPQQVFEGFRALVGRIHSDLPETRVGFIAVKPSVARWSIEQKVREANELVRRFAATDPRVDYLDIFTPMLGPDGTPRPDLFAEDGLHLNASGYDIWESVVEPYVRR
jgi:lysophospholipase L1-like esterase